jgi:hypothetical protein
VKEKSKKFVALQTGLIYINCVLVSLDIFLVVLKLQLALVTVELVCKNTKLNYEYHA